MRDILAMTLLGLFAQALGLAFQLARASALGVGVEADALIAASVAPTYLYSVLMAAFVAVTIPILAEHRQLGASNADEASAQLLGLAIAVFGATTLLGCAFARSIVKVTAPGFLSSTDALTQSIALVLWPSVIGRGLSCYFTEIQQMRGNFIGTAVVSLIGVATSLVLSVFLHAHIGVYAFALAPTFSAFLQLMMLAWPLRSRLTIRLNPTHPAVRKCIGLSLPLIASGCVLKSMPLVERIFGSTLPTGSIAQLAYAQLLVTFLSGLISGGLAAVMFPRLAEYAATAEHSKIYSPLVLGIRSLWVVIAPIVAVGIPLSGHFISVIYQRGRFSADDTGAVGHLFAVYLVALPGLCLGAVVDRALYALKMSKALLISSLLESLAYICYAFLLSRSFGAAGLAWAFVVQSNVSLALHFAMIKRQTEGRHSNASRSLAISTCCALITSAFTVVGLRYTDQQPVWTQLIFALTVGIVSYAGTMKCAGSEDFSRLLSSLSELRLKRPET